MAEDPKLIGSRSYRVSAGTITVSTAGAYPANGVVQGVLTFPNVFRSAQPSGIIQSAGLVSNATLTNSSQVTNSALNCPQCHAHVSSAASITRLFFSEVSVDQVDEKTAKLEEKNRLMQLTVDSANELNIQV